MARRRCASVLGPAALTAAALAALWRLEGWCPGFSVGTAKIRAPPKRQPTAADDWLLASRRVADGRADAPAHLEAAWERTSSWWLRPAAWLWAVALGSAVRCWCVLLGPQAGEEATAQALPLGAARAPGALAALQRLELPFFATSADWVTRPFEGVRVRGNLREWALLRPGETLSQVRSALEEQFGHAVVVHLLEEGAEAGRAPAGAGRRFELLVTDVPAAVPEDQLAFERLLSLGSLAAAVALGSWLSSAEPLQRAGAAVAAGSQLPLAPLLALLLAGEAARLAAARSQGVRLTQPAFLPSPQLGLLGAFTEPRTPSPSRASELLLALSAPLTVAGGSMLLLACSALGAGGAEVVAAKAAGSLAWPLDALPQRVDALAWAGAQGLLVAALALLPSSPDGQAALRSLRGRAEARRIREMGVYLYPLLGLAASALLHPGWCILPLTWTFLVFNFGQDERVPPLEEASEVPDSLQYLGYAALACAMVLLLPGPLNLLWSS